MRHFRISAKFIFIVTTLVLIANKPLTAQDELKIISGAQSQWLHYTDAPNALYHHLAGQAYQHLEKRGETIASISSLDGWQERQQWIRETLQLIAGPFPRKTPLNANVVKVLDKGDFRLEHIIFESQPGFYVTASLYLPASRRKRDKAPVIIYCSGHANEGYRSKVYQHVILNLVKKGFIVFAFDPVGQGERLEYYDAKKGTSSVGGPTSEHSYPGSQAFITGSSQARFMIWDGIRAVDYLLTRPEVDPSRIGITGRSGGGTQSAYIAAFDERIKAAAPECYITNFTRLLQSIGPQDAEQNFIHEISAGLDHGDLLIVRAPKPALMITTTRDMFSIQGARETAKEITGIYKAYARNDNFNMVEDDAPHASTKKNREAMYAFFRKHLDNPGNASDQEVSLLSPEDLQVTSTGQVSTSLKGETVFTLNRKEAQQQLEAMMASRKNISDHIPRVLQEAKNLSGYREPREFSEPVFAGRLQRTGYAIEKYFLKGEGNYVVPYLLMVPHERNHKTILYLHPEGKEAEASVGGEMEWFVKKGYTVMAPDLAGTGETGAGAFRGDAFLGGVSHNIWYASLLIGRSIVGIQAGDIARLTHELKKDFGSKGIYAVARKEMTPVLIHAAAFIPAIERISLLEPLTSYRSLVMNQYYHSPFILGAIPASLTIYDLPDLAGTLAPRKLMIAGSIKDPLLDPGKTFRTFEDNMIINLYYLNAQSDGQVLNMEEVTPENFDEIFTEWIK